MKQTTRFVILAAALFAGTAAFAADAASDEAKVTLRSGKVLQDAYILDKKPNGVTLAYKDGCMFVKFSDMPLEYQQKFGYDPIKSARYEKRQDDWKKVAAKEEAERKDREQKRKSSEDKHYRDPRINAQQQKVSKLELELEEAKKRLETAGQSVDRDRQSPGLSSIGSKQVRVESPWGYSGSIRSAERNGAVRKKLEMEADAPDTKRSKQAQEVHTLQLKLEAAQMALDELLRKK